MALLPDFISPTVQAIYDRSERKAKDWRRPHLGASVIGRKCERHLWYLFHWASKPTKDGRVIRLLARGDKEDARLARDLKAIGVNLITRDPETGKQFRVEFGPHTGGSMDGHGTGFPEAPNTDQLYECKTASGKNFEAARSQGIAKWKPEYWAQVQTYMWKRKLTRTALFVVNKETDEIHQERIEFDPKVGPAMEAKGARIVQSPEPLSRISDNPTWWECKFCDHAPHCQLGELAVLQRNCRTCLSATARPDGTWHCDLKDKLLTVPAQKRGCKDHRFIPRMLTGLEQVDVEGRDVKYNRDGVEFVDQGQPL